MSAKQPRAEPSYEAARDELVDVVRRLEAGGVTLEESLALWERGEELAGICQRWLDGAKAQIEASAAPAPQGATQPDEAADPSDEAPGTSDDATD